MGIEGKSYTSLGFRLGVSSVKTLYNWEKKHPEWVAAKEVAQSGRLFVIENMLQGLATGENKGNAAAAIFYAKNAAPDHFKDKREIEMGGSVTYLLDTGIPQRELPPGEVQEAIESDSETIEAEFTEVPNADADFEDLL